ncbi:MAG: tRNA lysidine(34) synthetase TilS [Clostridia bacterium]|nr:tRNA lysidine(34) synthetase TilS [Clostridia bacterium]
MNIDVASYIGGKICVAVSGGKDSMALLHFLHANAKNYGITLSALNCDHKIRGEASARDSAFVKHWCEDNGIPVICFEENCVALAKNLGQSVETAAREWRRQCYVDAAQRFGADFIATAHHLNDNAETVLFNIARGAALSGVTGIGDCEYKGVKIIRPMICCTRGEIDAYIEENGLPYVVDETNFKDAYTRNYIRLNVLAELEKAVPNAAKSIYRFSRIAREDEEYFNSVIKERNIINNTLYGAEIAFCKEAVIFRRAAVLVIKDRFSRKDYTLEHLERLYNLQFAENGKKFEFLGLTAIKEEGRILFGEEKKSDIEIPFKGFKTGIFGGLSLKISENAEERALKFDAEVIPENAVIRTRREGDRFTKFGGGTKSLGDYFTDRKIPHTLRDMLPLIAYGSEILAVCGVEISDKIKVTERTEKIAYISLSGVKND